MGTTVYILTMGEFGQGSSILGVFATAELARKAAREVIARDAEQGVTWHEVEADRWDSGDHMAVREHRVVGS
jgi:hypothetical protein